MGSFSHVTKHYIRKVLANAGSIDPRILIITYVGLSNQRLQYIQKLVKQHCPFERIYLQKASSAIASNCGPGSFGLLFMRKNDAVISFSQMSKQNSQADLQQEQELDQNPLPWYGFAGQEEPTSEPIYEHHTREEI